MLFVKVSEVLTEDKCRLSLSGWFHGPSIERPSRYMETAIPRNPHIPRDVRQLINNDSKNNNWYIYIKQTVTSPV